MRIRPRSARLILSILAVALLALVFAAPVSAKTLSWRRWDSEIWINQDGTFTVRETYEIQFIGGPFHFGYRKIPVSQFTEIRDVSVSESGVGYSESGGQGANTFEWGVDSDQVVINWYYPETSDLSRVFTVQYTVVGGLIIDDKVGDRFFWKAIGPDHAYPVESSTITVHVPTGAKVDTAINPFYSGAEATYFLSTDQTAVTYQTSNVPENQYFEVGVRFPHGYVPNVKPPWQGQYEKDQVWNDQVRPVLNLALLGAGLLVLVVGLLAVYFMWLTTGRDPEVGAVPEYLSDPPSDLPPGLVGTLVDEKADLQDIMATLVDLARRGAIDMEERDHSVFGMSLSKDFTFHKRADFSGPLRDYESSLISEMFGSGSTAQLEDLKEKFYRAIPKLQSALYKDAVKEGLFPASPQSVRGRYVGLGIVGLIAAAGLFFCVGTAFVGQVDTLLCPFVSLGVVSIALMAVSGAMPAKSRKGAEESAKWRAFKTYLETIDRYTDVKGVTDQFDKYLAFAVAFGLERTWINKFARIPDTPMPGWYFPVGMPYHPGASRVFGGGMAGMGGAGAGGGIKDLSGGAARPGPSLDGMSRGMFTGLNSMSSGLFSMLNSTSHAFTSVPHSSGSSGGWSGGGFSGGGFSSGGGGGGGGAGFG